MTSFTCDRCNYNTNVKCNLVRHQSRKIQCKLEPPESPYTILDNNMVKCNGCKKELSISGIKRHLITCKKVPANTCEFCHKTFANAQSKCNHRKTCKARNDNATNKSPTDPVVTSSNPSSNTSSNNTSSNNITNI